MDTKKLRQKILDLAIHGKLVPQDPNDEPASVLLERIRAEKEQLIKEGKIKAPKKSKSAGDTSHYPKDVPFEVPEGWVWCCLSDVGKWQSGSTPSGGTIPWLKTGDLNDGYINSIPEFITEKALEETSVKMNPVGSVLIAMYGATIGKVGILTFPATTNQACCACSEFNGVYNKYLFYFLISHKDAFIRKAGGGAQPNISKEIIVNTPIPIPPAREQERIVNAIESWLCVIDGVVVAQQDLLSRVEDCKSKVLDLAIHGKLVPQDSTDEPAIELLKRINPDFNASDNLHYEDIPQSWTVCRLSDVCVDFIVPQRDKPKIFDGDIPWCRIEDIEGKYLNGSLSGRLVSKKTIQQMNMRICPVGTVICSCSASIGTQAIVTQPCCTNQTFIGLVPDDRFIYNEFLYYFLSSQTEQFLDIGTGTTIKYISREKFEEYRIPLPPLVEQRRIVERIEYCFLLLKQIQSATSIC